MCVTIRHVWGCMLSESATQTACNKRGIYHVLQLTVKMEPDLGVHIIPLGHALSLLNLVPWALQELCSEGPYLETR